MILWSVGGKANFHGPWICCRLFSLHAFPEGARGCSVRSGLTPVLACNKNGHEVRGEMGKAASSLSEHEILTTQTWRKARPLRNWVEEWRTRTC